MEMLEDFVPYGPCEGGYEGCEGEGPLVEDPYEADVNNNVVLRYLCSYCCGVIADEI